MIELEIPAPVEFRGWCPTDDWEGPDRASNLVALRDFDRHQATDHHRRAVELARLVDVDEEPPWPS